MNQEIKLIFKTLQTLFQLVNDRGFTNNYYPNYQIIQLQYTQFMQNSFAFDMQFFKKNNQKLIISFLNQKELENPKEIEEKINHLTKMYRVQQKDDLLLIYNQELITKEKKKQQLFNLRNLNTQILSYQFLQFNVSRNKLVPQHEKLLDHQVKDLQKSLKLQTLRQLPFIFISDPQCKYHGFRLGDVIRITRTSTQSISYRLVVENDELNDGDYDAMITPSYNSILIKQPKELEQNKQQKPKQQKPKQQKPKQQKPKPVNKKDKKSQEQQQPEEQQPEEKPKDVVKPKKKRKKPECTPEKIKKCEEQGKICNPKSGRCKKPPKK